MRIADLPDPVTASKADWLSGSTWLGFTPKSGSAKGRAQCQSTIQGQISGGYVLEYITKKFDAPNPGFDSGPEYAEERRRHAEQAGRFIAVHRLQVSSLPLETILGEADFSRLQDKWASPGKRHRWSVAFPIVETYEVVGWPLAQEVLGEALYKSLYHYSTGILRPLSDNARRAIASLELRAKEAPNYWIAFEKEVEIAMRSDIERRFLTALTADLALEGYSEERRSRIRRRAAHLASRFVRARLKAGRLTCDRCGFDPAGLMPASPSPRGLLDVHHRNPIAEGVRLTTFADLALLCPICHRHEHQHLKLGATLLA